MKNRFITLLTILTFWCHATNVKAQEMIDVGERHEMYSAILKEKRTYYLYIPQEVKERKEKFAVVYVLDGENFYLPVVGMTKIFTNSKMSTLLPCVVVGIVSEDRTRDFTFVASNVNRAGKKDETVRAQGGGALAFMDFMGKELMPEIVGILKDSAAYSVLMGHSYAALLTYTACMYEIPGIKNYICVDPSFWWADGEIMKLTQQQMDKHQWQDVNLYLGHGSYPRTDQVLTQPHWVDYFQHRMASQLEKRGIRLFSRMFEEESHGTVAIPGFYDGLKKLFVKPLPKD